MQLPLECRPRLGISACLLGQPVRFNGGHKESRLCSEQLARHIDFVPLCPEQAIGLGTPRPSLRLVGDPEAPRALITTSATDVSSELRGQGRLAARELDALDGFVFMQKSPSCGLFRVKVYGAEGHPPEPRGRGLFAEAFCAERPELPVEEAGRLNDPVLLDNFLVRVYVHAQFRQLLAGSPAVAALTDFHARHKYLILAHEPLAVPRLGRLLAEHRGREPLALARDYLGQLMSALARPASRGSHCNALQHMAGHLSAELQPSDRQELSELIQRYRRGELPLVVPLTLLRHHLRHHPEPYLARQAYLLPHPEDLCLRNAI